MTLRYPPTSARDQLSKESSSIPGATLPHIFLMVETLSTGGSERQFCELARALDRKRFQGYLGLIRQRGTLTDEFGAIPEFPLGGSLYGLKSLQSRLRLAKHLKGCAIQIAHSFDFYSNLTLIPAARFAGVPVVIGSQRQLGDLLSRAQSRAQLTMFRWCDAVICNSRAAAAALSAAGLPEYKIAIIGNALSPEAFAEAEPAVGRRPGLLRVAMIARMNARYKNHHVFLRAAARLLAELPEIEFLLAGDGPLRGELQQMAGELGIAGQVKFLGDRRDIPAILASVDVSVVPSISESLSNVALESMAAGVPVVATRVGGNPELIDEDRGLLVPPDDEQVLAAALSRILRDASTRSRMAEKARAFARDNFSRATILARYQDLYCDLLHKKTSRAPRRVSLGPSGLPEKIRVAIVAPSLRYVGGQSVQAELLLRQWQHDPDIDASLIAVDPRFPGGLQWMERIPLLRTVIREPLYLFSLWCGLKHVDVVHIFSASYWSFLIAAAPALLISKVRGKKAIINYHSGEARDHLTRFRTAHIVLKRADMLVVPSGYLVDVFREFGLSAQVVPNVVDLTQFSFRERNPVRPHLVCTRGFHPYYCIDDVVATFAEVQKVFPDARLDLVGKGPLESKIRGLVAELHLTGVNFAGVASREEIGRFYELADIFINASRLDNMPVSIIEAFASGTPVATTAPECMRYLVEHERTGLLSPPGDALALAKNVLRLLNEDGLASRLAARAYQESRRYHWSAVRGLWLQVYRAVLAGQSLADMPAEGARTQESTDSVQVVR